MLWKPYKPIYARLIKTTIEGLGIKETKEMRKRGLAVLTKTRYACSIPRKFYNLYTQKNIGINTVLRNFVLTLFLCSLFWPIL
ncbi:hypothetical protein HN51_029563 [Arachis hypogaea]